MSSVFLRTWTIHNDWTIILDIHVSRPIINNIIVLVPCSQTRPVFVFWNTNTYLKYKYCIWKSISNVLLNQSIWKVFKYFILPKYLQILFLTHQILFIPSSASYEHLFYFGSIIWQGRRGRLTDENFKKLIVSS